MIPAIVAHELRQALLDYLETTFSLADPSVTEALLSFLTHPVHGIFKGPYVNLQLPFRKVAPDTPLPLEVAPTFVPYAHQMRAFERLHSGSDHAPEPTLVTTGTGSGKTECFLYPVLDHCLRHAAEPGIKAILLYPMNALAADQARRLAGEIWNRPELKGRIIAGMYVGRDGSSKSELKVMTEDALITDRAVMRSHPPDILLTNYRMLDMLLLRHEDKKLWAKNAPETLRYLVLDELHTYDGAQGGDVACLIRRLKARVRAPEGFPCPVGTSATLGGGEVDGITLLREFAGQLFGQAFDTGSVVTEDRLSPGEFLPHMPTLRGLPAEVSGLLPLEGEEADAYFQRCSTRWFGQALSPTDLGQAVSDHEMFTGIVNCMEGGPTPLEQLEQRLGRWDPAFADRTAAERHVLLLSFLSLISRARVQEGEREGPVAASQVQLWTREMSRLMREVRAEPAFFWREDRPRKSTPRGLPPVYCRECGHAGWMALLREGDNELEDNASQLYAQYFKRSRHMVYIFPAEDEPSAALYEQYLCPACLRLLEVPRDQSGLYPAVGKDRAVGPAAVVPSCPCGADSQDQPAHRPFRVVLQRALSGKDRPKDLQRCPECSSNFSLRIVGSQAASLSSVAISHFFLSPLNQDKKLLAFTDSVQDASHRSGFFAARTYRIGLRTAIQSAVMSGTGEGNAGQGTPLDSLGEQVWETLRGEKGMALDRIVAALIPPDLLDLPEYTAFMKKPTADNLRKIRWRMRHRLQWEVTMEYGHNARLGRSLEKMGASGVGLRAGALDAPVERLMVTLPEELEPLRAMERQALEHFLRGLVERSRVRGAVDHTFLRRYAQEHGKWYWLTKRREVLMSPMGSSSRLPRMLTDRAEHDVFDSYIVSAKGLTWYADWAGRCLGMPQDPSLINELYRKCMAELQQAGVLVDLAPAPSRKKKKGAVLALDPGALAVHASVTLLTCPGCGHRVTVPASHADLWRGQPCLGFRCTGTYAKDPLDRGHFYRALYRSGQLERIFTSEHTGMLKREAREEVEKLFKDGGRADAPNLLTCTPTLEMGIDVGDLSATMACSVPPTTANYLQRIGRAGRRTGNAMVLTMANVRPHDLFFFEDPLEMMAGQVTPPGCFLDAPEVLKRQLLAFCWDCWTAEESAAERTPKNLQMMLSRHRQGHYTAALAAYIKGHRDELVRRFLDLFGQDLRPQSAEMIQKWGNSTALSEMVGKLVASTEAEIKQLRNQRDRIKRRLEKLEKNPAAVENLEELKQESEEEMGLLLKLLRKLNEKYPLQLMTDGGLLPNYAFPETGVTLKAVVRGVQSQMKAPPKGGGKQQRIKGDYETHEWQRPASQAISELAPFNTFYAEGRKVTVDQVDVGGEKNSKIERWVLCHECHYLAPEVMLPKGRKSCPACGAVGFDDTGRRHDLLRLRRVSSQTDHLKSRTSDDSDERQRKRYTLMDFFDVQEESWGGGVLDEEELFGFEYLSDVTLRELNFGPDGAAPGATMTVASETIPERGFRVCADCGVVEEPYNNQAVRHRFMCAYNKTGRQEKLRDVYLYRELSSEAIRVLLPVSAFEAQETVYTFMACLGLGLRRKFRGQPVHLVMREQAEPTPDGGARRFLVLFDSVPGGTGYLKELAKPEGFFQVLEMARETLVSCSCRNMPGRDGCYRCIYAYEGQYDRDFISRKRGVNLLERVLSRRDKFKQVQTLSKVSVAQVEESELENMFELRLAQAAREGWLGAERWSPSLREGKVCYELTVRGRHYLVEPQVKVGSAEDVSVWSEPDFMITSEDRPAPGQLPPPRVAVFTDGFGCHVQPESPHSPLVDDLRKRRAIFEADGMLCWSITYQDVKQFKDGHEDRLPAMLAGRSPMLLGKTLARAKIDLPAHLHELNAVSQLLTYLGQPAQVPWRRYVAAFAMSAVIGATEKVDTERTEDLLNELLQKPNLPELDPPQGLVVDPARYTVLRSRELTLAILYPEHGLRALDTNSPRVVLRLEDYQDVRKRPDFKETWRRFYLLANLLQFIPRAAVTTTELAGALGDDALPEPFSDTHDQAMMAAQSGAVLVNLSPFDELVHPLVAKVSERGLPLPAPLELENSAGAVVAEAEMAWLEHKLAILAPWQEEGRGALESRGWTCLGVEALLVDDQPLWPALAG